MKAWQLLLLGIGACAEPARRPPTTYVPIARGPDNASALPPGPLEPLAAPLGQDPTSAPATASPKAATNDKPEKVAGADPINDAKCFRGTEGSCCTEPGFKTKRIGGKLVCPTGTVLGKQCKSIAKTCPKP
jgi:hypothetical protein